MAEYLAPGVYVEEVERGPVPIAGVSTSTAGFLGETERGPVRPRRVTSVADFTRIYGGVHEDSYLAHAIHGFFANGGNRSYVGRIVPRAWLTGANAAAALGSATLRDSPEDEADAVITVEATGPGPWGGNIVVHVEDATMAGEDGFKLTVGYWRDLPPLEDDEETPEYNALKETEGDPTTEEVYDDLVTNEASTNYYENRVTGISNLITLAPTGEGGRPANGTTRLSADPPDVGVGTTDYVGLTLEDYDERTGLQAFTQLDGVSIVCVPDENQHNGLRDEIVTHCENLKDRIAVLQAERNVIPDNLPPEDIPDTSYAAFYYPWLKVRDPETNMEVSVPPGGHITGIYARTDAQRGVHKAPANEIARGARGLEIAVTKADQESLNPKGVNCIRSFRGRGIRVWGARTLSSNALWKYVNVRRLLLYIEQSIDEGTQWVVFEPNNEETWARVRQSVRNFLTTVWEDGGLMGTTPDEAFYVRCDRTTMSQDDIDNGRLICEIGVAPVKPAEFVIFRISQWTGEQ